MSSQSLKKVVPNNEFTVPVARTTTINSSDALREASSQDQSSSSNYFSFSYVLVICLKLFISFGVKF